MAMKSNTRAQASSSIVLMRIPPIRMLPLLGGSRKYDQLERWNLQAYAEPLAGGPIATRFVFPLFNSGECGLVEQPATTAFLDARGDHIT